VHIGKYEYTTSRGKPESSWFERVEILHRRRHATSGPSINLATLAGTRTARYVQLSHKPTK
jgi:hypothetical protein